MGAASADGGGAVGAVSVALCGVDMTGAHPHSTGLTELDRVLGGGLVPGSVTLVGGEPGVGKSTLLLQVLRSVASTGATVVLVSAEESAAQVRLRAERLGPVPPTLMLLEATDVRAVAAVMEQEPSPSLIVVDSIQAVAHPGISGLPGSVAQVRACAEYLVRLAKSQDVPFVLVGHVTKDGALAGPRMLEHLVDTVITVEGDRHHALRMVRATKHRFGPTGELGLFAMGDVGLAAVADPYQLLLGDRRVATPGSVVLPAMEGQRALLVEIQALRTPAAPSAPPRRSAQGVDGGRLALLLAVLEQHGELRLGHTDVFASAVGGIRVTEPAADLALVLALASAVVRLPLCKDMVAFGEVGLAGELRQVPHAARRLSEAARIGFRYACVPASCPDAPPGIELLRVTSVLQAVDIALTLGRKDDDLWLYGGESA
jgi:DNA repair protein RadA/Sms